MIPRRGVRGAVLAVSGLATESRIAAGPGVLTVAGGGDARWLAEAIERQLAGQATSGIVSFGIAGALAAEWPPGSLIVASRVVTDGAAAGVETDPAWRRALRAAIPFARDGAVAGSDTVVATAARKAEFGRLTGAVAVDMESHVAARLAARHGLPFAVIRAIADPVHRGVPPLASTAMLPGGGVAPLRVVLPLLRAPEQLPGLLRVALDARLALRALARGRRLLGERLGCVDLDQLALDVV